MSTTITDTRKVPTKVRANELRFGEAHLFNENLYVATGFDSVADKVKVLCLESGLSAIIHKDALVELVDIEIIIKAKS